MTTALMTLLEHAERLRDAAKVRLLEADEAVRRLQLQAQQLDSYRLEYRARHPALAGRSAGMEMLRVHEGFMQRLDQAVSQQAAQLSGASSRAAQLRAALLEQERRVASARKLIERRQDVARRGADRQEQHRNDEFAQFRHGRQDAGEDSPSSPGWRLGSEPMPLNG